MAETATPSGGQAAPAQAKPQLGSAAPALPGKTAGLPSAPSSEAALVAEKKKAEHWQKKYERDVAPLQEQLAELRAKFDGLATGFTVAQGQPAAKPAPKTFSDLDENGLREVLKRGMEDQNPDFIFTVAEQLAERIASKKIGDAEQRATQFVEREFAKRQAGARIVQDFGPDAVNEESDLHQRAMGYLADMRREDPQVMERHTNALYNCFKLAREDLRQGETAELTRLREEAAERQAREEFERSARTIRKERGDHVDELLKQGDRKSALREALPFLKGPARR